MALAALGSASPGSEGPAELEREAKRFVEVFGLLDRRFAEAFDPAAAIYGGALPAMLRTLDPHSAFLDPQQFESLREMQRSTEKGFGSVVNLLPGRVIVLQTLPDSPSARAGVAPGDEILVLNGQPLAQLPVEQLIPVLASARQGSAKLMVRRPNFPNLLEMTLIPAEMADPSVSRRFVLEPGIAYAKILNFETETAAELQLTLEAMGGERLNGLVLDLRGNPGGVIEAAVQVAAFFLDAGDRILWVRGRSGPKEELLVPPGFEPYKVPLRILIDNRTASAAELVAGALQDHGRARVLGQRSFGKGLVQSVFELSDGTALALTTAFYQTPRERAIQRWLGTCGEFQLARCPQDVDEDELRGGVVPDRVTQPRQLSELEQVLLASNSFLEFARDFVRENPGIGPSFEPDNPTLDDFQFYLSQRRIRPSISEWSASLEFIRHTLKQEVLNLAVGVAAGDEVEIRRDPAVVAAVEELRAKAR
jgi:carboxyl-terminal processing protease